MDHKIPAVFVDTMKDAGVWEQDWGFVVYRATFSDGDAWEKFKDMFSSMNHRNFDHLASIYSNPDDVRTAQRFWKCRFVDDPGLEGKDPEAIMEYHTALSGELPKGLQHPCCLVATDEVLQSLERHTASYLDATIATAIGAHPFVKVLYRSHLVDDDMDEDEDPPVKMFNTGMRVLIDELFPISIRTQTSLDKLDPGNNHKVWLGTAWEEDIIRDDG